MTAPPTFNPGTPWHTKGNSGRYLWEDRVGIMLHYDASASDKSAVAWMRDPDCRVSYNWMVLDNGGQESVAPLDVRAWHAGPCRSSNPTLLKYKDANWAFYGIAIAATDGERATGPQKQAVANLCGVLMDRHRWSRVNDLWRIVGHDTECHPRGRKPDPTGTVAKGSGPNNPVLSVQEIREMVMR